MMRRAALIAAMLLGSLGAVAAQSGLDRAAGKALFERIWVPAPTSTDAGDGLGPLFAERACTACHSGPGGGASIAFVDGKLRASGATIRFGDGAGRPDAVYGRNLQARALPGLTAEGELTVTAADPAGPLDHRFTPARGPVAAPTRLSFRLAPPLIARARADAASEAAILALADPDDRDGDGISGRPHWIETPDGRKLGRFGWKAEQPDLARQIADAFAFDIGISSPLVPRPAGDCTAAQADCLAAPDGRSPAFDGEEISAAMVELVAGYLRGLEPPPKPAPDGTALLAATGCTACHVPSVPRTDGGGTVTLYSDLLLHDLGPDFDDGVGATGASASEWRTTPLAGLAWSGGPTRRYLHDGRAATLDAAIRAHGGEAAAAAARYADLPAGERRRLIAFLEAL